MNLFSLPSYDAPLDSEGAAKLQKYIDLLKQRQTEMNAAPEGENKLDLWKRALTELYKEMILDAFKSLGIQRPAGMEVYIAGSLAKAQATPFSDLDSFAIFATEADAQASRPVFEALNKVFHRIFLVTNQLAPDPIGINPTRFSGTVETLFKELKEPTMTDPDIMVASVLTSHAIFGSYELGEALKNKIREDLELMGRTTATYYFQKMKEYGEPEDGCQTIHLKNHILRPLDFLLAGLRERFNINSEDGAHLSVSGTIQRLREEKLLDEDKLKKIESVITQAMKIRLAAHETKRREADIIERDARVDGILRDLHELRTMVSTLSPLPQPGIPYRKEHLIPIEEIIDFYQKGQIKWQAFKPEYDTKFKEAMRDAKQLALQGDPSKLYALNTAIAKRVRELEIQDGWLDVPDSKAAKYHKEAYGATSGAVNNGWKIHISLDPTKMVDAMRVIYDLLNSENAPRISIKIAHALTAATGQPGKQAAFYFYEDDLKDSHRVSAFLNELYLRLMKAGIGPEQRPMNSDAYAASGKWDAPILLENGKPCPYFHYRMDGVAILPNDSELGPNCMTIDQLNALPLEQRHNPLGLPDPFSAIRIKPTSNAFNLYGFLQNNQHFQTLIGRIETIRSRLGKIGQDDAKIQQKIQALELIQTIATDPTISPEIFLKLLNDNKTRICNSTASRWRFFIRGEVDSKGLFEKLIIDLQQATDVNLPAQGLFNSPKQY